MRLLKKDREIMILEFNKSPTNHTKVLR